MKTAGSTNFERKEIMKRITCFILVLTTLALGTITMISCGEDNHNNSNYTSSCSHIYVSSSVVTEPTCTTDGTQILKCSYCGATKTEVIPSLGHNVVDGECTICGD